MRTAFVRRTVLSAAAVSLALLATACGGEGKADAKPSAAAASAAPVVKGKTDAELAGLVLAQTDLTTHVIEAMSDEDVKKTVGSTTDKPECLPLFQAQSLTGPGAATGNARVVAAAKGKEAAANATAEEKLKAGLDAFGETATAVSLHSYEGKGAQEAFGKIKSGGSACAAGYTGTQDGETVKISKVGPGAPVTGGDESVAYTIEMAADGEQLKTELVVVRKGNTLAVFNGVSFTGTADQPVTVVAAQLKKLG
ncbi:hypothetical protein OHA37_14915 [Streptomyces sp. NBC_00335]|uniref:hypothetical protein n=1 Tax=unclassified Streptomyces TaxID=2593676 RepID=UPI0022595A7B|nr:MULTISPECIES: hypothetical protein [unclassified Streptomyces]MCX5405174.1 hypothetical protein [Streptomyces sp. NBC_00086]